jgi:hypothetical protein
MDKDVKDVSYTSKIYMFFKVARVTKQGRDSSEFELGKTLLHFFGEDSGDNDSSCF